MKILSAPTQKGRANGWIAKYADFTKAEGRAVKKTARQHAKKEIIFYLRAF
jgi:hypothetical protein